MLGRGIGSAFKAAGDDLVGAWPDDYASAVAVQRQLAACVVRTGRPGPVRVIAGADVAYSKKLGLSVGAAVLCRAPSLEVITGVSVVRPTRFPYIPGLLSFREAPVILTALEGFRGQFDLLFIDGQGYAHPRRLGLASHVGVLLDVPTVGCAKSRLVGDYEDPGPERGAALPLTEKGERVGTVLRTRTGVKPLFVSVGHLVNLRYAEEMVIAAATRYRIPEPLRRAHNLVTEVRKEIERRGHR